LVLAPFSCYDLRPNADPSLLPRLTGMRLSRPPGLILSVLLGIVASLQGVSAVTIYRIGAGFSVAESDSLADLGIDYKSISWLPYHSQDALDHDSLATGLLQPNFLEVDEDIASGLLQRGGRVWIKEFATENTAVGRVLLDQDPTTAYGWRAIAPETFSVSTNLETFSEKLTFDLGGRFLIREFRFRPLVDSPDHFLESFTLGISDAGYNVFRIPIFDKVAEVSENVIPEITVVMDPPLTTDAVQLRIFRQTPKEIGLASFEIYGGGFVKHAAYESEVIVLDDIASWGEIRWSGQRDPDSRVDIRTRSGNDPQPQVFWESRPEQQDSVRFLQGGGDLSLAEYETLYQRLSDVLKPGDPDNRVSFDADHWSFWSSAYAFDDPGVDIVSPGPRKYFQFSVDFASTVEDGGNIDFLEFRASVPPAVRRLIGEIYPIRTQVGSATQFTYYIRPTIRAGDTSFNGVEISTPSGVISVDSLRIAGVGYDDFSWSIHDDGRGFEVLLPHRPEPVDSGALVEIVFTAPVLREVGTSFAGRVFDTELPLEVRQRIIPGNADDEVEADQLSVTTSLSSSLLFAPRVEPNPFTPNGDGINDVVSLSYKLLRLTAAVPVSIRIYDLSGRLVKSIWDAPEPLGEYVHTWDGTDQTNRLVPPGLYLYRIGLHVQSGVETNTGVVAVAY